MKKPIVVSLLFLIIFSCSNKIAPTPATQSSTSSGDATAISSMPADMIAAESM